MPRMSKLISGRSSLQAFYLEKQKSQAICLALEFMVGDTRFELVTPTVSR